MRVACLLVPDLPLVAALRAQPELAGRPMGVTSAAGPRAELVAISPEAAARGVRRGSTVVHARTVCAELCLRVASPALEQAARAALLDVALSFSPRAALAPRAQGVLAAEASVALDATGIGALFRSEAGFAAALGARSRQLGLPGNVAVAGSQGVARVAARQLRARADETCIVPAGQEAAFLAPLPLDLLDPDDAVAEALTRFGVHTVRQLLALPRAGLSKRLGPRALALVALACGEQDEPPLPTPGETRLIEAVDLEFSVDRLEPLKFVLQGLLSRLLGRLEARHLACGDLMLVLELCGGGRDARRIGLAAPTHDLRVLVRLLTQALEVHPPEAPVESVRVETPGQPLSCDQLDLFRPAGPAPTALDRTLAELQSLCGDDRVGAPRVPDDHRPDAFALTGFSPGRSPSPGEDPAPDGPRRTLAARALRPPAAAEVRLHGAHPAWIRSAVAQGRVLRLAGPWRTTGSWWSHEARFAYDHFDVQTSDGVVARLRFDHVRRRWEIDAVYD